MDSFSISPSVRSASQPPQDALQPVPFLDFSRQFSAIREEVLAAMAAVCDSQRFILGPEVAAFEREAAAFCRSPHAIGCASGTDALWLALAAAGIGDTASPQGMTAPSGTPHAVITSPFSFFASASCILRAGARPVFADIDPLTFNVSAATVTQAIERHGRPEEIRALLPVHLFGQCADMPALNALAQQLPHCLVVEDAAQAFGASWAGVPAGALGDAAAFSFYPTKNLAAMGDAGLVTTRSAALGERAQALRAHGMRRRYFHDEVGWNSRLDTLQAAVLLIKLRSLPAGNQRRRELAARYNQQFLALGLGVVPSVDKPQGNPDGRNRLANGLVLPYVAPEAQHIFHQYVIRAPRRDELRAHLTALGIGSEIYYPLPLHLQDALTYLGYRAGDFPEAERAAQEVLALPIYPELREDEQDTVVEAIRRFYVHG